MKTDKEKINQINNVLVVAEDILLSLKHTKKNVDIDGALEDILELIEEAREIADPPVYKEDKILSAEDAAEQYESWVYPGK